MHPCISRRGVAGMARVSELESAAPGEGLLTTTVNVFPKLEASARVARISVPDKKVDCAVTPEKAKLDSGTNPDPAISMTMFSFAKELALADSIVGIGLTILNFTEDDRVGDSTLVQAILIV